MNQRTQDVINQTPGQQYFFRKGQEAALSGRNPKTYAEVDAMPAKETRQIGRRHVGKIAAASIASVVAVSGTAVGTYVEFEHRSEEVQQYITPSKAEFDKQQEQQDKHVPFDGTSSLSPTSVPSPIESQPSTALAPAVQLTRQPSAPPSING